MENKHTNKLANYEKVMRNTVVASNEGVCASESMVTDHLSLHHWIEAEDKP